MSKFYTFSQNNTGGRFIGPAQFVIIEADSAEQANSIADNNDLYFDGIGDGRDCPCCGDRWHSVDKSDGKLKPKIYGKNPEEYESIWKEVPTFIIIAKEKRK